MARPRPVGRPLWIRAMKVDHFASLLRAVARLEHTSYEARGAIYDQAQSELMERLRAAEPPCSEADIDRELLEFRAAVRRVEFGDMDEQDCKAQQAIAERAQYLASRREARQPAAHASPPEPTPAVAELATLTQRRSVFGRVAGRMILAAVLIAFGLAGYAYDAGRIDASGLNRIAPVAWLLPRSPEPAEAASYYEQAVGGTPWRELTGSARWRSRLEDASVGPRRATLTLDLRVPERGLSMSMAIRRDAGEDTAITHLFEFMFLSPQGAPLDSISAVKSVIMKQGDGSSSRTLAGLSIKVAPGLFLFGLSAEKDDARRNAEALQTLSRFDIPVSFADGSTAIISVSKGAPGERAFAQALADWAADPRSAADQRGSELLSQGALWMRSGSLDRR
jgi:hypothetical protein